MRNATYPPPPPPPIGGCVVPDSVYLRREQRRRRAPPRFGIDEHIEGLSKYKFVQVPNRHGGYKTIVKNYVPDVPVKNTARKPRAGTKATTRKKASTKKVATKKAGTTRAPSKKSTKKPRNTNVD